ncbi:flagellar basal-body MS-ring/collar protein FliF [Pseudooceanicola onchidii]|uniref:flagellar basal-body MS-ring/collar protein FliF n=1 Tax=Pseudooceanicola onchidii TaxID=2562279 RepID=UPI0010AB2835|nr:flagellar basal-body MS-ring/collar protein FliF [Pseudooceanicola onchidii]
MQQITTLWTGMDPRRRIVTVLSMVALLVTVMTLTRMATQPGLALLYSGLESGQAGEVVRSLEQRGVPYEVRGGAIYVDGSRRDELRMTLASEGLPRNNSQGYELLDTLTGFGTTSQMFDAAYWRAKEGELARTIASGPQIQAARVHIANVGSNPFQRDLKPTASVSVTGSGSLSSGQVRALKFLVASAVAGLRPEDVAIIDSSGELLAGDADATAETTSDDRADKLRERVQRLLEARVGFGNAVVEVSVDTVTESESIRQRTFDPESRIAISTETEERTGTSQNTANDVTVASNLPDGNAAGGNESSSQSSETRERVNYEVSETEREVIRAAGAVKRLTVAVLVNGLPETDGEGAAMAPREDAELAALRDLVASAVGFDEARGDVITIKSMVFEEIVPEGSLATSSWTDMIALDAMALIQMGILALVAIALGLFVVRPVLRAPSAAMPTGLPAPDPDGTSPAIGDAALTGEITEEDFSLPDLPIISNFDTAGVPGFDDSDSSDPVDRLKALIGERRDETVEILRGWLEDREETAR